MAAAFLLRHRHAEARAVLTTLGARVGMIGFGAKQALARWADGTWQLDPEDRGGA
jgi:hypothetical protein